MTIYEENIETINETVEKKDVKLTSVVKVTEEQRDAIYQYRDKKGDKNTYRTIEDMLNALKDKEKYEAFNNAAVLEMAQGALKTLGRCFETLEFNKDRYVEGKLMEMTSKLTVVENEKNNLQKDLDSRIEEVSKIQSEVDHFKKLVENKELLIKEREEWLEKAQLTNKDILKEKDDLEKALKEKDSNFNTVIKEFDKYKRLSEDLKEQLDKELEERKAEIKRAESFIKQDYFNREKELKEEIANLKEILRNKDIEINKLEKGKTQLEIIAEAKENIIREIKTTNKKDIDNIKNSFKEDEKNLRNQINELISEKVKNEAKMSQFEELEMLLNKTKDELQNSEAVIKNMKKKHEQEIRELKDAHFKEIDILNKKLIK